MPAPIDFYFDFSSPYGYIAAQRIAPIAARHGRDVCWRPFLLGAVFKATGSTPLMNVPIKGDYSRHDIERTARLHRIGFVWPPAFPFLSVAACRACYWLSDRQPERVADLILALFARTYGEGGDIAPASAVVEVAAGIGLPAEPLAAALQDPEVKERLRQEVEAAMARGVFGSPFFFVDEEPFWGHDRLDQVERWLETGGW